MFACLLLTGCRSDAETKSHYEQVQRQIEQLKAQAPPATGANIKIEVNTFTTSAVDYAAVDTLWRYADRNVIAAKRPDVFARSGLKIGLAASNFRAQLKAAKRQTKFSEETELFIIIADGATGYINIGKEIRVPRFHYFGKWYNSVDYQFLQAGRSLKVTAHKLASGLIEMKLTPVFSKFLNTGGDIELTELTTSVTVRPGQSIVLGGSAGTNENAASALFSYSKGSEKKQTLITVTPYLW